MFCTTKWYSQPLSVTPEFPTLNFSTHSQTFLPTNKPFIDSQWYVHTKPASDSEFPWIALWHFVLQYCNLAIKGPLLCPQLKAKRYTLCNQTIQQAVHVCSISLASPVIMEFKHCLNFLTLPCIKTSTCHPKTSATLPEWNPLTSSLSV